MSDLRELTRTLHESERHELWVHLVASAVEWLEENHVAGSHGEASIYTELSEAIDRWQSKMRPAPAALIGRRDE